MPHPILRDFPDQFETARLLIRAPRPGDGPELNRAVLESLAELRPWMEWAQEPPSPDTTEEVVRRAAANFLARTDLMLLLFLKGTQTLVGSGGLHRIDWQVPRFEIGYWCRTPYQGQGYITEAVRGITAFAFDVLGARRVEVRMDPRNARSRRVAERAGFEREGELRNDTLGVDGEPRNTLVFSLVR